MGRQARDAADRLLDRADQRPERTSRLPARVRRRLPGLQAERRGGEPPGGKTAYVANTGPNTGRGGSETVSGIDTGSVRVTTTIPLGAGTRQDPEASFTQINHLPTAIALGPDGDLWVACNASSSLVVIDPSSNTVRTSIALGLGDEPTGIAFA